MAGARRFSDCNSISERDEKVTQAAVREELGDGSFTTIGTVVRQGRENTALQAIEASCAILYLFCHS